MNQPAQLILTVDYEVFGDGSGQPRPCVLGSTERILAIAESRGVPLTLFVEALEFAAMEREPACHAQSDAVRLQLTEALARGHDLQLHLHPQWWDAKLDPAGSWQLDLSRWRIGDLPFQEVAGLLEQGKVWLEELGRQQRPDYRCIAFRAGGWCIQPSALVLAALSDQGILIDSSVAPGLRNATAGEWSDFRDVPDLPFWNADQDLAAPVSRGVWEFPILTGRVARMDHLKALRKAGLAEGCQGSYRGPGGIAARILGRLSRLRQLGMVMLDFSTLPAPQLIEITRQWCEHFAGGPVSLPLAAIGHSKNFTASSERALTEYLDWINGQGIVGTTYPDALESISSG
ncbi:MAG: hypothetical protein JMN27_11245 [gamma proteobacterium endosymbiont of Lamellibrachia anaximandri]|nr:hypothetical protein [gamma proteobacterium endosymbiont of Lamellibrachia anaximandri]MBL3534399.1 hypothetical protein [gamma proteobacterium endosymbiont of Lamellibrachia anaximandri]